MQSRYPGILSENLNGGKSRSWKLYYSRTESLSGTWTANVVNALVGMIILLALGKEKPGK